MPASTSPRLTPVPAPIPSPSPAPIPSTATSTATATAEILRSTLRRHAAGVTVITVPGPAGFTATSFTSVSLRPALVSFCVGLTASAAPAVERADRFAVHLLGDRDTAVAARFATSGIDRFAEVPWHAEPGGLPRLDGVSAWLTARVTHRQTLGDHVFVVGEVDGGTVERETPPLVHHDGAFAAALPLA
ncbi:flavin reductase family protein [Streptomyces sp. NPDC026672]|uniref:flavin reductase family protein n=1 Tax=unclassified Streptomyces TaxID=2593676 RepID=UPI0033C382CD